MDKENADKNLTVRVPATLVEKFRAACIVNYKTMSEAVRDLMQEYIKVKGVKEDK
jgi:metal-responsive CopG/Arc/MetJ family transcriptional regulator